jgi:hypothetical protein
MSGETGKTMPELVDGSVDRENARLRDLEAGTIRPIGREKDLLEERGLVGGQAAQRDDQGIAAMYPESGSHGRLTP